MDRRTALHRTSVTVVNRLARTPRAAAALFAMVALHDYWSDRLSDEARFLAFCAGLRHLGHGQLLEDLWVLFELDLAHGGYFVEFGAYDATVHSNTRLLEERFGWNGLLAEPNPDLAQALRRERSAVVDSRCVWDVTGDTVDLSVTQDGELSTVTEHAAADLHTDTRRETTLRRVAVPTVSLNDLLEEHRAPAVIDFMSVDTEGTELRILRSFDFARHQVRLVAVEHNGRRDEADLDALMAANGYERRFASMSDWDGWYRLRP